MTHYADWSLTEVEMSNIVKHGDEIRAVFTAHMTDITYIDTVQIVFIQMFPKEPVEHTER